MLAGGSDGIHFAPRVGGQLFGQLRRFRHIDGGLDRDIELCVVARNVEVVHGVAVVVAIREQLRPLRGRHVEPKATLPIEFERLHAQFHHALAHGRRIDEAGEMPDEVLHG